MIPRPLIIGVAITSAVLLLICIGAVVTMRPRLALLFGVASLVVLALAGALQEVQAWQSQRRR